MYVLTLPTVVINVPSRYTSKFEIPALPVFSGLDQFTVISRGVAFGLAIDVPVIVGGSGGVPANTLSIFELAPVPYPLIAEIL